MQGVPGPEGLFLAFVVLSIVGGVCAPDASAASSESSGVIEKVVVTAQKRTEKISDIPQSASTLSGDELDERNYRSMEDFRGAIPGMQVNNYASQARINIRGIGNNSLSFGADPHVAFSVDGVYMGRASAAAQAFLDVERVEVLRGPQGTLYGRNATGGVVNVVSKLPTREFEVRGSLRLGNYDEIGSQFIVSGPLASDSLLGRLAVATRDHDGYSDNLFNGDNYQGAETRTVRGTLLARPSNELEMTLRANYHTEDDTNYVAHFLGLSPGFPTLAGESLGGTTVPLNASGRVADPRTLNTNDEPINDQETGGVNLTVEWFPNNALTVRSITAYREKAFDFSPPQYDGTDAALPTSVRGRDFFGQEDAKQLSQELQLVGTLDRFDWVAGFYYFQEEIDPAMFRLGLNFGTLAAPVASSFELGGTGETDAYAAFGEATWSVTPRLRLTAGLRYSYEERSVQIVQRIPAFGADISDSDSATFDDFSPKFSVAYYWSDEIMTYATVSKGFKSGGYDLSAPPPAVPFSQEEVWSYEVGVKLDAARVQGSLAAFHYDYENLQVAQIINDLPATRNAATSEVDGVEVSGLFNLVAGLTIDAAFSYLDARYTDFETFNELQQSVEDLSGNRLAQAPEYQSNVRVEYVLPIDNREVIFSGEWNWHDRIYHTEFNSELNSQPSTSTYNAAIRLRGSDSWWVELYGRNLSDEDVVSTSWISSVSFGAPINGQLRPPRMYGIAVGYAL